ncbi:MAG: cation:proton antiporter subunit C [Candidatus Diapherotrites archaeon]|nr:cation:proton antiporter subunit C [Candidatus Diapherotrites archaeon]
MSALPFIAVALMVAIGIYAAVMKRNLVKIVLGVNIIGSAANLFLVAAGYREGAVAPIFTAAPQLQMVLPTPQALTLTSIVINLAVTAMMLSFAILIHKNYGSADSQKRRLLE